MSQPVLQTWTGAWPVIKSSLPLSISEGVIDQNAFDAIEVDALFNAVNHASTTIGQAVLYRSLTQPLQALDAIQAKQDAVKELQEDPALKAVLERIVQQAAEDEKNFYLLLFGEFLGSTGTAREEHEIEGFGYLQYRRGVRFMLNLVEEISAITTPKSVYLQAIFTQILSFTASRDYSLMQGPVYLSEQGIHSKEQRETSWIPAIIFKPRLFKPLLISLVFGALWAVAHFFPTDIFKVSVEAIPTAAIFLVPMLLAYVPIVGGYDRDHAIIPLRNDYRQSQAIGESLDALGQLDELLSFLRYAEAYSVPSQTTEPLTDLPRQTMVLPDFVNAIKQQLNLRAVKNPVLGKGNPNYVANDFVMEQDRLVLITGPNSGGKTAFCKTITQSQLLAQIGCFIPAEAATLSVADKIFYQVPEISQLSDGEGRFGTELKRTKEIFLASSAKSLIVLDELSEGTTFEEKMESSTNVLNGFYRKGCNTLLITHNHQLVDHFIAEKIGLAKQVEFSHELPTYRLIEGISRVSHADRVAKKIGFSKQDIDNYLEAEQRIDASPAATPPPSLEVGHTGSLPVATLPPSLEVE
ncbi:MAG: DNA mismatch repair protein MutS [Methylococcales bacterium]|nr:DNA mismatch repair protein MutS [Methylococcales bacterium]